MFRLLAITLSAVLIGCAGTPATQTMEDPAMLDFSTLDVPSSPNTWVIAPDGYLETAEPDAVAPVFAQDPATVFATLVELVAATPRTSNITTDSELRQVSYTARVAFTIFRDDIDIAVLEADDGGATLVAYSRSRVGYSDFGVNEKRLTKLVANLTAALSS
ncbi:MAG: DUF1499 domain-containing protein [Pseudomonadota bacterium]